MYKIVPNNEITQNVAGLSEMWVTSFATPRTASFLVTEEREKPLPNWP